MGSIYRPKYKDRHGEKRESAVWWIKYYSHGRAIRESTDTADLGEAKDTLKKREGQAVDSRQPSVSRKVKFAELAEDEINDYQVNGFDSIKDLKTRFTLHILPFFGSRKALAIQTPEINRYIVQRQDDGASNGTINRELTAIKRAFTLGNESGKIHSKPYIPMLKENNVREGFFEREQFDCLLSKLTGLGRDSLQPMLRFAYITGWRIRSEVRKLQWRQVDFKAGTVRLEPGTTKNDEGRTFPLTIELREILEAQRALTDELERKGIICPWVFHRKRGRQVGEFKRAWKTACEAAGLPGRIPHDFRRTAVRNLVRAGIPERVAMQMTGHKTRSVFERYNIVSEGDLFDAARKLDLAASVSGKDTGKDTAKPRNSKNLKIAK